MNKSESNENKFEVPTWRDILKRLPNARSDWAQKKPLQKFCYFYGIGKISMDVIAFPTFREDQSINWFAWMGPAYTTIVCILMLYTIAFYTSQGEILNGFPCTCLFSGPTITCIPYLLSMLANQRYLLHSLVDFGGRYIYRNHHDDKDYQMICAKAMNDSMKHFISKMMMIALGYTAAVTGPIYANIAHGIRTSTIDVAVPYTEENSLIEFAVNMGLHTLIATHGGLFYLGGEVIMELFSNIITTAPRLIEHDVKRIISENAENRMTSAQLWLKFANFVRQCNDANEYVSNVAYVLYWRTLVAPGAFFYSIGMSIYCQFTMGFAAGYGLAFMSWTQFFYYCELGESAADNGFVEILYNCDWYLLPTDLQKDILHLIHRQQYAPRLTIGPFGADLNRELFKVITNKIYSFVMFLLKFGK